MRTYIKNRRVSSMPLWRKMDHLWFVPLGLGPRTITKRRFDQKEIATFQSRQGTSCPTGMWWTARQGCNLFRKLSQKHSIQKSLFLCLVSCLATMLKKSSLKFRHNWLVNVPIHLLPFQYFQCLAKERRSLATIPVACHSLQRSPNSHMCWWYHQIGVQKYNQKSGPPFSVTCQTWEWPQLQCLVNLQTPWRLGQGTSFFSQVEGTPWTPAVKSLKDAWPKLPHTDFWKSWMSKLERSVDCWFSSSHKFSDRSFEDTKEEMTSVPARKSTGQFQSPHLTAYVPGLIHSFRLPATASRNGESVDNMATQPFGIGTSHISVLDEEHQ